MAYLQESVERMKPGQDLEVDRNVLSFPCPPPWTPAEWILEHIMGSAWEYSWMRTETGNIKFRRRLHRLDPSSGLRTFISADRKHLFTQRPDGLYEAKLR